MSQLDCTDCGHRITEHSDEHPHACVHDDCDCMAYQLGQVVTLGSGDHELVTALRQACLLYVSLVLSSTAEHEDGKVDAETEALANRAFAAMAQAGYALVESAKARSN